jgi:hypothetical protein
MVFNSSTKVLRNYRNYPKRRIVAYDYKVILHAVTKAKYSFTACCIYVNVCMFVHIHNRQTYTVIG